MTFLTAERLILPTLYPDKYSLNPLKWTTFFTLQITMNIISIYSPPQSQFFIMSMSKRTSCKINVDTFFQNTFFLSASLHYQSIVFTFYNIPLPLPTCVSEFMSQWCFEVCYIKACPALPSFFLFL